MSRSNPNDTLINPATKFISWSGDEGYFKYFDKSKGEKGENVKMEIGGKTPFMFLPLDALSNIRGYSDADGSGFWSNEVRDLSKEVLTVRTKAGIVAKGLYKDIKDNIAAKGAKYCQSVYVAMKGANGLEICNLQLVGAALTAWIEFVKGKKIFEIAVKVSGAHEAKKGKTVYQVPVFEQVSNIKQETSDAATELDKELQEFLKAYLAKNASEAAEVQSTTTSQPETKPESPKTESAAATKSEPDITFNIEDDGSDIPF